MTLVREELIEKISRYFKLMDFEAEKVFDDIFNAIMEGVSHDKVVYLDNFGEFIIKYNGHEKSVEFLPKQTFDDELNYSLSANIISEQAASHQQEMSSSGETTGTSVQSGQGSIEEELKKKREAILSKLSVPPPPESLKTYDVHAYSEKIETGPEAVMQPESKGDEIEDESKKSFSDYFSEVSKETSQVVSSEEPRELETEPKKEERVIPPNVVELHKEIVGGVPDKETVSEDTSSMSGYYTQSRPLGPAEQRTNGRPYYIWYKDSEPSPQETETLSIEYELLYQAQKEAQYRSKLKIYVTTFILFFSFVLILLIFSPLIYKFFFSIQETETVPPVQKETTTEDISQKQNVTTENSPPATNTETQTPPTQNTSESENKTQAPQTNVQQQTPEKQTTETAPQTNLEGLTKNALGWADAKNKAIYILLGNNKYTIQESAWDSETKADKRLKTIESLKIPGLTGNIIKADLGEKGIWYRACFGEFNSLDEARKKAVELREKSK